METKVDVNVRDSGVVVGAVVRLDSGKIIHRRELSPTDVVNDIASRITGKLVGFDELYDRKTGRFLSREELSSSKIGACFISVNYRAIMSDMLAKSRVTKIANMYRNMVTKTSRYEIIANIDWQSFVNRRGHGEFVAQKTYQNGTLLIGNCKAVGITTRGNHTVNGVIFATLEPTRYYFNGAEIAKSILAEYMSDDTAGKATQAEKHGIAVEFDPQFRTTAVENCDWVRGFGFEYVPMK